MMRFLIYFLLIAISVACNNKSKPNRKLAEVYGHTLYESELDMNDLLLNNEKDSANVKHLFTEHWIKDQLLLRKAKISKEDKKAIEKLTGDYENSLIVDFYKERIIKENIDSTISDAELNDYYKLINSNFKLSETVYNFKFIKLIANKQTISKIKQNWDTGKYKEIENVIHLKPDEAYLQNDLWMTKNEMLKFLPSSLLQENNSYSTKKNIDGTDYFLKVTSAKHKNEIVPLAIVKDQITELILKKRKSDVLDSIITEMYKQETKNSNIKIYEYPSK
jgi:hypothetical protein